VASFAPASREIALLCGDLAAREVTALRMKLREGLRAIWRDHFAPGVNREVADLAYYLWLTEGCRRSPEVHLANAALHLGLTASAGLFLVPKRWDDTQRLR
jgi:hypothetical protein